MLPGFPVLSAKPIVGQTLFDVPGTYYWECPAGVSSICVVCIGGGGHGKYTSGTNKNSGAGGGLAYRNHIPVTPGHIYEVVVGGASGTSKITVDGVVTGATGGQSNTTRGLGGSPFGTYDGGGSGGESANAGAHYNDNGGGGAAGYNGNGGAAGIPAPPGGGGAGGGSHSSTGGGGGGVGPYGEGPSGSSYLGQGGSYGEDGNPAGTPGRAGLYGGGAGSRDGSGNSPGTGAVRIIWGKGREFPSTNTADV